MSEKHPVIAITGSSGAGTTSVMRTFEQIFHREGVKAAFVEGDAFHRYDRAEMKQRMAEELARGNQHFSHFGPENNLFAELEALFRDYGAGGGGRTRKYLHDEAEAAPYGQAPGTFTAWEDIEVAYRLMQRGMRMLYRPEAVARHHHDITFASFRRRQQKAGEAAAIFYRKHPELGDFLAVPQAKLLPERPTLAERWLPVWAARSERRAFPGARRALETVLRHDYLRGLKRGLEASSSSSSPCSS